MKFIIAVYASDAPDSYHGKDHKIPWVVSSTHPRFVAGTQFDYGFLQIALGEGYDVQIRQVEIAK